MQLVRVFMLFFGEGFCIRSGNVYEYRIQKFGKMLF